MSRNSGLLTWQGLGLAFASMGLWVGCASHSVTPGTCAISHSTTTDLPERGISAHRGGLLGCPVNTIGAFQQDICQGVHQIELDVRATADGALVVAHDDRVTGENGQTVHISEATLAEVQSLRFTSCTGETERQRIPTFEEALALMPQNIWINVDIKENNPQLGRLIAQTVANAHRFDQVIFGARDETDLAIRRVAEQSGTASLVANMSRQIFRGQYVDTTIDSCDEFIQLSFLRGKPDLGTIDRLKQSGVRVNYSWLSNEDRSALRRELGDLFDRGVHFVLVDHPAPAMEVACTLGIPPIVPRWTGPPPFTCQGPPSCPSAR